MAGATLLFGLLQLGVVAASRWTGSKPLDLEEQVAELVVGQLEGVLDSDTARRIGKQIASTPLPFEYGLVTAAVCYAPIRIGRTSPDLADTMKSALVDFLENPSVRELKLLPACDLVFLNTQAAAIQFSVFMQTILAMRGVRSEENSAVLLDASTAVISQLHQDADPILRALLSGVGGVARAVEHQRERLEDNVRELTELRQTMTNFLAQLMPLLEREPTGATHLYFTSQGAEIRLLTTPEESESPLPAWMAATEDQANRRGARRPEDSSASRALVPTPTDVDTYLDPYVEDFEKLAKIEHKPRLSLLSSTIAAWLQFSSGVPLVLVGDAGAGKTTSCRWILRQRLERYRKSKQSSMEYCPLYVSLSTLRPNIPGLVNSRTGERGDFLLDAAISRATALQATRARGIPKDQRVLLVLDGFDELALTNWDQVRAFFDGIDMIVGHNRFAVLLTGRTMSLEPFWTGLDRDAPRDRRWRRARLQPFARGAGGRTEQYARTWIAAASATMKVSRPSDLVDVARDGMAFGNIVETPVLLALLCRLWAQQETQAGSAIRDRYGALAWLVEQSIVSRANPDTGRMLSPKEALDRTLQYEKWAWQAVLNGGTDFEADIVTVDDEPTHHWLVEFFFRPSAGARGRAAFVHRTVAEHLAAGFVTRSIANAAHVGIKEGMQEVLALGEQLALKGCALEANFKWLLSRRVRAMLDTDKTAVVDVCRSLVFALLRSPSEVPWRRQRVPVPELWGGVAELCAMLLLAAADGVVESEWLKAAATLQYYSPRRGTIWQLADPIRELTGDFAHLELRGFNFENSRWLGVVATETDFSGGHFDGATLHNCIFRNVKLSGCRLRDTVFAGCELLDCRFEGARLERTRMLDCTLSAQSLLGCSVGDEVTLTINAQLAQDLAKADANEVAARITWIDEAGRGYEWTGEAFHLEETIPTHELGWSSGIAFDRRSKEGTLNFTSTITVRRRSLASNIEATVRWERILPENSALSPLTIVVELRANEAPALTTYPHPTPLVDEAMLTQVRLVTASQLKHTLSRRARPDLIPKEEDSPRTELPANA
jgi:hypothetical protein